MDLDSGWIEKLSKSNHAPSDESAEEIKRLLLEPSKELECLEAEILNLRNRLSQLESKRNETQKRISRYESILSPIRRVPHDVLEEIFYHCLPTHRNPIMRSRECPLLLTHICKTWRASAISTPRLWDRLYITFTDEDTVPDLETFAQMAWNGENLGEWRYAQPKAVKQRRTDLLLRRYYAVKEWFLRSGNRPLSISISFTTTGWYKVPYSKRQSSVTMEFLSFLASLSPRWKDFEAKGSSAMFKALEDMLAVSQMTALDSIRVDYPGRFQGIDSAIRPLALLNAPNLRRVSVMSANSRVWDIVDRPSTQWNKLTHVSSHNPWSISKIVSLLKHTSNLVHFKAVMSEFATHNVPTPYEGQNRISLPFLQTLSINDQIDPQAHGVGDLFNCIDAPILRCITYHSYCVYSNQFSADNPAPVPILPLLRKSTNLQKLTISTTDLTICDIAALLRPISSVTDLTIGAEVTTSEDFFVASHDYDLSGGFKKESWSLKDLIVGDSESSDTSLLPRLRSLTLSSPNMRIRDDDLFDLIKSRMKPERSVALESVRVIFHREKESDVAEELGRHAELVGVKINIDFNYLQIPLNSVNSLSPDCGLRGPDGRSWKFLDAGETI